METFKPQFHTFRYALESVKKTFAQYSTNEPLKQPLTSIIRIEKNNGKFKRMYCKNELEGYVCILLSKKRCIISDKGIMIKKGVSKKNAVIKIRGSRVPNGIGIRNYHTYAVKKQTVENIPYFDE